MTAAVLETPVLDDPTWCGWKPCLLDDHDGSRMHMSPAVDVPTVGGTGLLDVRLIQCDEETEAGRPEVSVNVGPNCGMAADLAPEQALAFIEVLRDHVMKAAGPDGVEMPVERIRIGDEIQTDGGWQTVEGVDADGWCCGRPMPPSGEHNYRVVVRAAAHAGDDDASEFSAGDLVRVRKAVA